MKRFVTSKDKFEIRCKKCDLNNVDYWVNECGECGNTVYFICNECGNEFDYHKFEQVNEEQEIDNTFGVNDIATSVDVKGEK
jgi:predicted amidophosphoribosyltransferase